MSIREAMLNPPLFFDMIQIDVSTRICILRVFVWGGRGGRDAISIVEEYRMEIKIMKIF